MKTQTPPHLALAAAALALGVLSASPARADTYSITNPTVDQAALAATRTSAYGLAAGGTETLAETYAVAGSSGNTSVTFGFYRDDGGYQYTFGFYPVTPTLLSLDLTTDSGKRQYARTIFGDGTAANPGVATVVYSDAETANGSSTGAPYRSFDITAGTQIGFFLLPNTTPDNFQANFGSLTPNASNGQWPLFSVANANFNELDQVVSLSGIGAASQAPGIAGQPTAVFGWEDILRAPGQGSDQDFNDLHFSVSNALPVPEPTTVGLLTAGGIAALVGVARRRRRRS